MVPAEVLKGFQPSAISYQGGKLYWVRGWRLVPQASVLGSAGLRRSLCPRAPVLKAMDKATLGRTPPDKRVKVPVFSLS